MYLDIHVYLAMNSMRSEAVVASSLGLLVGLYTSVKGEAESSDVQLGLVLALTPIRTVLKSADRAPY